LKILITIFSYPPNADGCAEAASVLARGLAARGHDVTVATEFHPRRQPDAPDANPRVVQFKLSGNTNRRIGIQGTPDERAAYQNFLRGWRGDLIIFENWDSWPTYLAEPLLKKLKPKKFLVSHGYTAHMWDFFPKFPWGLGYWLGGWPLLARTPWLMRRFDRAVFLSERRDFGRFFDHRLARLTGFKKISVIPNGAHAREFNDETLPDFRKEFGVGPGPLLLCVANYSERKNQLLAVRAFRRAQLPDATLALIGSAFNDFAARVRQLDVELQKEFPAGRILMLEKLSRAQTCAAYRAADLFVLPAKAETQPIVLLEAMASRTPWLSTDTGCVAELPGGLVVQTENEMVEKMKALMADASLREQLAEAGWAACQKTYDWEKVVAAYARLVTQVCGKS
jgi:glycosyltransferase involved in cell wall biosynthesis